MAQFVAVVAVLILAGVFALSRQLALQGARAQRTPLSILVMIALSYLLLTPPAEAAFAAVRMNSAYLLSHLCVLAAVATTTLYWRRTLSPVAPGHLRPMVIVVFYCSAAAVLVALFVASPQQPYGAGFAREFAGKPWMQLYWIIQAVVMIPALVTLAGVAVRARRQERKWRRGLMSALAGAASMLTAYEMWVIVVAVTWPAMPPQWAQYLTTALQLGMSTLLVVGATGPVTLGTLRSTRLARSYAGQLAPLHEWLTGRYPQVRFRAPMSRRAETRVTDMLIEVSDGLRLLQRADPATAAVHGLDHDTIVAAAGGDFRHAAYELAAARLFRTPPARIRAPDVDATDRAVWSSGAVVAEPVPGSQQRGDGSLDPDSESEQPSSRIGKHSELPTEVEKVEGARPSAQQTIA